MLFQTHPKKFTEGDQEWKLPYMDIPKQSKTFKVSTSYYCNSLRKSGPRLQELPVKKIGKIRFEG